MSSASRISTLSGSTLTAGIAFGSPVKPQIAELEIVHNKLLPDDPRPDAAGEYETFGDDERLAREHAEYFYEEYLEDAGYRQ